MSSSNGRNPYNAQFQRVGVRAAGAGSVRLECTIRNSSDVTWTNRAVSREAGALASTAGPISLGYNVFDLRTGLLVMEGEHVSFGEDIAPGATRALATDIQLPPEEGRYRVWIAPVEEGVSWFYDHGSDFVELEVSLGAHGISLGPVRSTSRAQLRLRRARSLVARALWYPWRTLLRHGSLILAMVRREVLGRYRGSMGGALWTLLHPLLLMAAYYFVFAVVLRVRFAPGHGGFVFYFICGMLPWLAFSEAVGRAPNVVFEYSGFVKRVVFPLEILPLNLTAMGLATELFALVIFFIALAIGGVGLHRTAAYFPAILIPQLLLTAGLCWFLASLGVFLRDTGQVMGYLLTIWFFVTPICYPASQLPVEWLWLFRLNPMYTIVGAYRAILLEGVPPEWMPIAKLWIVSLIAFWGGYAWFFKSKKSFADLI